MDKFTNALEAVGQAAQVAGELGGKAYNLVKGVRVPGGIKNAARVAYQTAKNLKNSMPIGSIGTKALNAARTFKNTVARTINPQKIANSASKAASYIGRAAQGAQEKVSQVGTAIQSSGVLNTTRKLGSAGANWLKGVGSKVGNAWRSTASARGAAANVLKGVGSRAGTALKSVGQQLMAPSIFSNPFRPRTQLQNILNSRNPYGIRSGFSSTAAPVFYTPAVTPAPMSAAPMSAAPMSAAPMSAVPMSAVPMSAVPMSAMPMSAMPMSAAPMSVMPNTMLANANRTKKAKSNVKLKKGAYVRNKWEHVKFVRR